MLLHLLEAALRSFALGGAVWLGLRFLRVQNPQTRMTAWTVVLLASLSMPVLMHWATVSVPLHSAPSSDAAIAPASSVTPKPATAPPTEIPPEKTSLPGAADNAGAAAKLPESYRPSPRAAITAIDWQACAIGLYLAVGGALLLRLLIGLALTWRLLRGGQRLDADWTAGSDVRLSAAVATPVTFGTTILLPAECLDWSPMKRQAVLAHERSHVARGDFHVLLLATLHRAVFWFSPFSWWLLNELAETAELVSDDAAIVTLGDRPCYAEILLDVAQRARPIAAGIAMARTRSASKRVDRILAAGAPPPPRLGWGKWTLVVASLAPLVGIATVSFSSSLPKESKLVKVTFSASAGQLGNQSPGDSVGSTAVVPELWISRIAGT
ncbi:MAG TPA: M56 family metallopeptidase, partial [Xanthobacteraceae bacterium]